MKKYFSLLLIFLVFMSTKAFAFTNSFFSVNDTGWQISKDGDDCTFTLKDDLYSGDEDGEKEDIPFTVFVGVNKLDVVAIPEYSQKELDSFIEAIKKGAYQKYYDASIGKLEKAINGPSKNVRSMMNNSSESSSKNKEIAQKLKELKAKSGIKGSSITKFGSYKAYKVDYQVGVLSFTRYIIPAYKVLYVIESHFHEDRDVSTISAYKTFAKSFNVKVASATWFNYAVRNYLPYIIFVIIGVIFKKKRNA